MKIINSSCLTLFLIITIALQQVNAQELAVFKKMSPIQKAKFVTDSLKTVLHLGDKQYPKVYNILLEGTLKAQPIIVSDCNKMIKGYKLKSLLAAEEAKLQAVLTTYQYQLYQQQKQELIAWFKQHKNDEDTVAEKL